MPDLDRDDVALLTVAEAAAAAGVKPKTIRLWLERYPDELHRYADPVTGALVLSEREVLDVEARRHESGRRRRHQMRGSTR